MQPLTRKRMNGEPLEHSNNKKFANTLAMETVAVENARKEVLDWVMLYNKDKGPEEQQYAESLINQFFGYDHSTSYYEQNPGHKEVDLALCKDICSPTVFHNIVRMFRFRVYVDFSFYGWDLFINTLKKKLELCQRNPLLFITRIFELIHTEVKCLTEMRIIYKALLTSFLCNDHPMFINCDRWFASMENSDYKTSTSPINEWSNYFNEYPLDRPLEEEVVLKFLKIVTRS